MTTKPLSPRALIVIPTLNEAAHLDGVVQQLLADIAALDRSAQGSARLVIVDGGSTDGTLALAEALERQHPSVTLLHNRARIQSAAINLAVRRFGHGCDVLIRCDAHAAYPPAFCSRLLATLERTGADAVVVPLDSAGEAGLQRVVGWVCNSRLGTGGAAHRAGRTSGFVDHGHHAAFRLDMFRRCGGYDETFTHNEDAELDCRQRALGARVYLDADIRVVYRPRASLAGLWRQYHNYGIGRSRTAQRHPRSLRLRQVALPVNLVGMGLALALCPLVAPLASWPVAYLGALGAAAAGLVVKHRTPAAALAAPVALVMHTAWA
ncbi:MAG TPA: glycosyltransferase family 2 protein, partial [Polyangiaceae bacterium]|nr:glycosyltransferase family 2 protein [Polyangiaceae bacterium]